MEGSKITALPAITNLTVTDLLAIVQGAATYKGTMQQALTFILANLGVLPPSNGALGVGNPAAFTIPIAQGSSPFHFAGPLANGQLLIGSTGADPVAANIVAGQGVSVTNGAGSITIGLTTSALVKFASATESNLITTSGSISTADVIPQNTQGTQVLSITYTPVSASNTLEIEVNLQVAGQNNVSAQGVVALFQDSTLYAIAAAGFDDGDTGSRIGPCTFKKIMVAGTTSPIVFSVRAGSSDGSAIYLNGQTGARAYGGVSASTITIKEYAA